MGGRGGDLSDMWPEWTRNIQKYSRTPVLWIWAGFAAIDEYVHIFQIQETKLLLTHLWYFVHTFLDLHIHDAVGNFFWLMTRTPLLTQGLGQPPTLYGVQLCIPEKSLTHCGCHILWDNFVPVVFLHPLPLCLCFCPVIKHDLHYVHSIREQRGGGVLTHPCCGPRRPRGRAAASTQLQPSLPPIHLPVSTRAWIPRTLLTC